MNIKNISFGILLGLYGGGAALANPTGANVVHGSASISASGNLLQVTNSPNAIIDWQSFSIANGETTQFIQQSAQSAVLNRVVGNNLSEIHGTLSSNGRVFLINQAGIVFGENALVDTAGLLASSLDIANEDFLAGKMHFEGDSAGSVINRGVIAAGPSGEVVLIAPQIENSGVITVQDGALILAAGESVTLSSWDLDGVEFEVQAPENEVLNLGQLVADQGAVGLFSGSIRNEGLIQADSLSVDAAGNIVLSAMQDITITEDAVVSASGVQGGDIHIVNQDGDTLISGEVKSTGSEGTGGTVVMEGKHIGLIDEGLVDASGKTGGGDIYIGGGKRGQDETIRNADAVFLGENTEIHADALEIGNGGTVIAYAKDAGRMHGTITAKGGSIEGDGGFIETSAGYIEATGNYDASAINGESGTWLLDPFDLEIVDGTSQAMVTPAGQMFTSSGTPSQLGNNDIIAALTNGDVIIETGAGGAEQGSITVTGDINWTDPGLIRTLTMNAHTNIDVNAVIQSTGTGSQLNVVLAADEVGGSTGIGVTTIGATGAINTNGGTVDLQGSSVRVFAGGGINTENQQAIGTSGNMIWRANALDIQGTVNMPNAQLTITSYATNPNRTIDFGGGLNAVGDLDITQATLDNINFGANGLLHLGEGPYVGNITVTEVMDFTGSGPLHVQFNTGGSGNVDFAASVLNVGNFGAVRLNNGGAFSANAGGAITNSGNTNADDIFADTVNLNAGAEIGAAGALAKLDISTDNLTFNAGTHAFLDIDPRNSSMVINSSTANGDIDISGSDAAAFHDFKGLNTNGIGGVKLFFNGAGNTVVLGGLVGNTANGQGIDIRTAGALDLADNAVLQADEAAINLNVNGLTDSSSATAAIIDAGAATGSLNIAAYNGGTVSVTSSAGPADLSFSSNVLTRVQNTHLVNIGNGAGALDATSVTVAEAITAPIGSNLNLSTAAAGSIIVQAMIDAGTQNLTITTDNYGTGGGTLAGSGDLVFNTASTNHDVTLGNTGTPSGLHIDNTSLTSFQFGFNEIAISTQGAGNIIVDGPTTVNANHLRLNSANLVDVNSTTFNSKSGGQITLQGAGIDVGAMIRSTGGAITLNGPTTISSSLALDTTGGGVASTGANILMQSTVDGDIAGHNLTLNAGTAGNIDLNGVTVGGGTALNSLSATGQSIKLGSVTTTGAQSYTTSTSTDLNGSLQTDGGAVVFNGDAVLHAANINIDTEQSLASNGGSVDFNGKLSAFTGLANASLTIDTTGGSVSNGGNVVLSGVDNTGGAFLETLNVVMDSSGGTAGTLRLGGDVQLSHQGGAAATTGFIVTGAGAKIALDQNINILTGNGQIQLSAAQVYASSATPLDLTINAGSGNVFLSAFSDNAGASQHLNDVLVTSSADVTLTGDINLDNDAADLASFAVNGGGNVVVDGNLTIDTEQGDDGSAGDIDFTAAIVKEGAPSSTLILDAAIASGGGNAGNIRLGQVGDTAAYLSGLQTKTSALGGGTRGVTELHGDIQLDAGGEIRFNSDVLIKSNVTATTGGGAGDNFYIFGTTNGDVVGAQTLTVNTGAGEINLGHVGSATALGDVALTTTRSVNMGDDINLDGSLVVSGSGDILVDGAVTIFTDAGANGGSMDVDFSNFTISGGDDTNPNHLTVQANTANAIAGGNVSLGAFNSAFGGEHVDNLTVDTSGTSGKGDINLSGVMDIEGAATFDGAVNLITATTINTAAGVSTGQLIRMQGSVDGAQNLILNSGVGQIQIDGDMGTTVALDSLSLTSSQDLALNAANVITNNTLAISNNISLSNPATTLTSNSGAVNLTGNVSGTALHVNAATGISVAASNSLNSFSANNSTSGAIDVSNLSALQIVGAGIDNQGTNAADNVTINTLGALGIDASVVAQGGDISINSNSNNITVTASGGAATNIEVQSPTSSVSINAGTANVLLQGGAVANSDVRIDGGNGAGGSLQIIANDLILQAGNSDSSGTKVHSNSTDIDLSGDLTLTAGVAAAGSEASIGGTSLLDVDLSGAGNITLNGGGAGASMSHALLSSDTQVDIDTAGSVILNGGAGTNSMAAIASGSAPVTINIGQSAAIGGDVLLNGGAGTDSIATIGMQAFSPAVADATISVRTDGDIIAVANTGGVQIGSFEQGGTGRATGGQVTLEAGLGASGGNVELENAIVQTGTGGQVTLAAHEVSNLPSVGRVTQGASGSILADQLYVQTFNAGNHFHVDLQATGNDVNKLAVRMLDVAGTAVSAGQAYYHDMNGFTVDGSALGLSAGESAIQGAATAVVNLTSGGAVTQAADVNSGVDAGFVQVNAVAGVALDNAENDVTFFGASNTTSGDVVLVEKDGFTVGGTLGVNGIHNANGNVSLLSTGSIGQYTTTNSTHRIEAQHLRAETRSAGSSINLSNNFNDVDTLTLRALTADGLSAASGALTYKDIDDIQLLGTGLTTGEAALQSASFAKIVAGGPITQGALAEDSIQLTNFLEVKTLNDAGADITLGNTNNSFTGVLDLFTHNAAGGTAVNATSSIFNSSGITTRDIASLGAVTLTSGADIGQTAGSTIAVDTLTLNAQTGINLDDVLQNHMIGTLVANNLGATGNILVKNNQSWTVDATNAASGGNIDLNNAASGGNTTLGVLTASTGGVSLQTGTNVIDGNGAASNIIANQITLIDAGTGIGSLADGIELEAATITMVGTGSGDIALVNNAAGTVATFNSVIVDGNGTGDIKISSSLVDADIAVGGILSTGGGAGSGSITMETTGANSDVAVNNSAAIGTTGNLVINSAADFNQDGGLAFVGVTRNASITAVNNITMGAAGSTTNTTGGSTVYTAGNNLAVNTIDVGANALSLTATGGAITDVNGAAVNVTAAAVDLISATGIDLDLSHTGTLNINQAMATSGGNIDLQNLDGSGGFTLLGNVDAGTGQVQLTASADVLQTGGVLVAADLIVNTTGGSVDIASTSVDTADMTAAGSIALGDAGALQINRMNSTAAGDIDVTTTGLLSVEGTGINNTSGNISLDGQGVNVNSNVNAAAGDVFIDAQLGALNVNDAAITASGTATVFATDLLITAISNKSEIQANGNVDITLTGDATLTAGSGVGADAILESTSGNLNLTAVNIGLTAGVSQDALIKAANGNAVLVHSGTCTNCDPTNITAGPDAGVIANNALSIVNVLGTSNWTGFGDGSTWSDANNWFGNVVATSGDINLDANMSVTPFEISVDSVIAANTLTGTKNLNVVSGGDLTIANNFTSTANIKLSGGELSLGGSTNTIAGITIDNAASALQIGAGATLTVANSLQLDAGSVSGFGSVSLNNFNWTGGSLDVTTDASGTTAITGANIKQLSANLSVFDATVNGTGDLDIVSGGDLYVDSSSPGLSLVQGNISSSDSLGIISNEGSIGKTGAGAVNISALLNNTGGLGSVSVNDGSLSIGATSVALNADDAAYSVSSGAQLTFSEDRSLQGVLTINAGSALTAGAGSNLTLVQTATHAGDFTVDGTLTNSAAQTFNGLLSGSGLLAVTSGTSAIGSLTGLDISIANGAGVNSTGAATAGTINNAGTLTVSAGSLDTTGLSQTTGSTILSGGTLSSASGLVDIQGGNLDVQLGGTLDAQTTIGSTGSLSVAGTQAATKVLTVNGTANILSGANLTLTQAASHAGSLTVDGTLTNNAAQTFNGLLVGGGVLDFTAGASTIGSLTGLDVSIASGASVNSTSMAIAGAVNNAGALTISAGSLDTTGLTQTAGSTTLSGGTLSSASGLVDIQGGSLDWQSGGILTAQTTIGSTGTLTVSGNKVATNQLIVDGTATIAAASTLDLTQTNTHAGNFVVNGTLRNSSAGGQTLGGISGSGLLDVQTGLVVANGNVSSVNVDVASAGSLITAATSNFSSLINAGTVTSTSDINVSGTTTLLAGSNIVGGGVLNTNSLLVSGSATVAKDINLSGAGTWAAGDLSITGNSFNIASGGSLNVTASAVTLGGDLNNQGQFSMNSAGSVAVDNVLNSGTVLLNSGDLVASTAYAQTAGVTQLNGGALTAATSIQGGTLSGNGDINGDLLVSNATLSPGNSAGLINVNGNLDLASGSNLELELGGLNPADSDQLNVSGNTTINPGANLSISLINGFALSDGDSFTPFNYASVSGDFSSENLPENLEVSLDASSLDLLTVIAVDTSEDSILDDIFGDDDVADVDDEIAELFGEFEDNIDDLEDSGSEEDEDEDEQADLSEDTGEDSEFSGTLVCG